MNTTRMQTPVVITEDVGVLNEQVLGIQVTAREWQFTLNGEAISKDDVPGPIRQVAKAAARDAAYEAGFYTFDVPGVTTASWTKQDWMNYVKFTTADL